jgi:D-3-phosphoglycerate dehydrogenase
MNTRVLISDSVDRACVDVLRDEQCDVQNSPGISLEELKHQIIGFDALIVRSGTRVTAEVIEAGSRLKIIGRAGTGVDNIDVGAATRRGILVLNTPGGNTVSAAEHTVSLLLCLARKIPQAHGSLIGGSWERKQFVGTEVHGKTLGVIGLGKIGRGVAARCRGLGMIVIGFDPVLSPAAASREGIEPVDLREIYRRSDFITVHTPLTGETRGLINAVTLSSCKRGVRVINCARGGIVDEAALLDALESGQAGGAALDVFEEEPPIANPLFGHPRVVVTPHLGASTEEAQEKVAIQIGHAVADALRGRSFTGVVNSSVMYMTLNEEVRPFLLLAERLGSLAAQLATGKLRAVTVGAAGDVPESSLELIKAGVLKGILSRTSTDPVNFISAPVLAAEKGLAVSEERGEAGGNYTNALRVRYETEGKPRELEGSVVGRSQIRLTMMDGYRFEVEPEGHLIIYSNVDKPGILARVGGILARYEVNIAGVSLGRSEEGGIALTLMNLDSGIPEEAMAELSGVEEATELKLVKLD